MKQTRFKITWEQLKYEILPKFFLNGNPLPSDAEISKCNYNEDTLLIDLTIKSKDKKEEVR